MFNIRPILILALASLTLGCGFTSYGDLARDVISVEGAKAMDEGLKNAEWGLCEAASIGSIKRRYGTSAERAKEYQDFCPDMGELDLFPGGTPE